MDCKKELIYMTCASKETGPLAIGKISRFQVNINTNAHAFTQEYLIRPLDEGKGFLWCVYTYNKIPERIDWTVNNNKAIQVQESGTVLQLPNGIIFQAG